MRYKVFSKLYFCSPVWSSASKKNISKLQKVQNFNARIITNTWKFDHITPVLQELRWLVGVLAFKCAKGLATSYLSDCFVTRSTVHDRNTRNNDCLKIYSSLSIGRRSTNFSISRAIKLWNSLPRAITATDNVRTFKKKLREFLSESFLVS